MIFISFYREASDVEPQWKKYDTPYTDKEWTREEVVAFEDAIHQHGAELRAVRDEVASRSIYAVVRFYGLWKRYDHFPCSSLQHY